MDIKQTLLKMFLFNKWLCRSESARNTSKRLAKLKRYLAISITFAELMNAIFTIGFSLIFVYNKIFNTEGLNLPSYKVFNEVSVSWFIAFFVLGVFQIIAMLTPSLRAVKASGLCMIASSLSWGVITGAYYAAQHGMITPATVVFGTWSVAVFFMGNKIIKRAILKEQVTTKEA